MNQTHQLLQAIVENARTGADACDQLLTRTDDIEVRRELMLERQQYQEAARDAETRLYNQGIEPKPQGAMARAGMWMGMQLNTLTDRSPSHIADMVIQGATMGVVDLTKARNSYPDADADAQGIAAALITCQQEAIERLKTFLRARTVV